MYHDPGTLALLYKFLTAIVITVLGNIQVFISYIRIIHYYEPNSRSSPFHLGQNSMLRYRKKKKKSNTNARSVQPRNAKNQTPDAVVCSSLQACTLSPLLITPWRNLNRPFSGYAFPGSKSIVDAENQSSEPGTFFSAQVNRLIWLSPLAEQANIMRCGWNAVADIGAWRAWCKKLEYGSMRESSLPSKLKTLTV